MNRATIALVGSALLIGLGTLSLRQAWEAIDPTTIVFLLSMMVVNASLSYGGAFQLALLGLIRVSRSPFGLLIMLVFGSGLLSAFLLNDTLALVFTPLTLQVTTVLGLNPIPYLLGLAAATNLGSVATLSGNPQNILIGSFSGIGYLEFAAQMTPIAVVGLLLEVGLLWLYYPEVRSLKPFAQVPWLPLRLYPPLLRKSVVITGGAVCGLCSRTSLGRIGLGGGSPVVDYPQAEAGAIFGAGGLESAGDVFRAIYPDAGNGRAGNCLGDGLGILGRESGGIPSCPAE